MLANSKLITQNSNRLYVHLGALLLYTALAIAATWPMPRLLTQGLIGTGGAIDSYQNVWNQWWVAHALSQGRSPFFSELLYYPDGIDLFWQTLGLSQALVGLPATWALGPIAAVNLNVLLSFILGGYCSFVLARHVTHSIAGALLAGVMYAHSSYHMLRVIEGSIELASIQWLPLYVLALLALLERPTLWRAMLAGLLLLWVSFGSWYYGLFAVLFTGCMALLWSFKKPETLTLTTNPSDQRAADHSTWTIQHGARHFLWGLAPLLLWSIVLAPRIASVNQAIDQSSWDMRQAQIEHSADLVDFFLPNPLHPLWGGAVRNWHAAHAATIITYWNVSLSLIGLGLALVGILTVWRSSWRWLLLLLISMLLAMGSVLRVAGQQTSIALPFALLQGLPGISFSQRPSHMGVLASLMLAILAAFGLARLLQGRRLVSSILITAALLVGVFYSDGRVASDYLEIHMQKVDPWYASLPAPDGALLTLPVFENSIYSGHMVNQITHHWPIMSGYVARIPRYQFVYYTDAITQLRSGSVTHEDIVSPGWPESGRQALAANQVRYVTLDLTTLHGDPKQAAGKAEYFANVRQLLSELGVHAPLVANADLEAYAVPRDWPVLPTGSLGPGWLTLEQQADVGLRWRWMGAKSELWLFNPYEKPVSATIDMRLASFEQQRALKLGLNAQDIGILAVQPEPQSFSITILLPPGRNRLILAADAAADLASGGQPISIRAFEVRFRFGAGDQAISDK